MKRRDATPKLGGYTLDAGALIAYERGDRRVHGLVRTAQNAELPLVIPSGVVGQVWRDGRRQARLASLLSSKHVEVEILDDERARAAGVLCGIRRSDDVIDASVVLCARRRKFAVVTSDREDLARLDPGLELIVV